MYVYTNIQKRFIWIRKRSDTAKFIILVKSDFLAFAALIAFFFFVEMHGHYCFFSFFFLVTLLLNLQKAHYSKISYHILHICVGLPSFTIIGIVFCNLML